MKIDHPHPFSANRPVPEKAAERSVERSANEPAETSPAAVTHLHRDRSDGDIDTARVAEIRQAISEGRLEIRADRIADGLIERVREELETRSAPS
ncbi:Anti-sigma-28 factor [Alloalcanivorax dieselolei B5]|uniref:Negative regulator of flagellin synthesis n=1 Tax=Alcanivorax dieselolei (strain DSM 16502 / CGMCC 1.3690 / MCCC 1A00001 / B-5) TaxID=930169 RepID=K0CH59_ALCDB|nr:flagellar biosynthesis anti-sigma factor FlgM [Alloalcanivorax dieselolei]AFT71705.1 Anti-sigma-28 factor [Alloalcanivorax dieselolei B5]GGJ88647.1 hypothetical protein GCM10007426_17440 [Alloalcanivorax dieselolei]